MPTYIHQQVEASRARSNPTAICRVPSGWAVLANVQFLRGYSILLPDPVVASLNDLDRLQRAEYLCDMAMIGDALMEVTGAYRINYAIMGNQDPALHAHIIPRYLTEPDEIRKGSPWSYPKEVVDASMFNSERDKELIQELASAIQKRL
jgi:diadenosine tetraphosphate (Ap4A) HIT family hydrolase